MFFADEAHFGADSELRGIWVEKGEPELVTSNSPSIDGRGPATSIGLPGERGGGMDGTGGEQQLRDVSRVPGIKEGGAPQYRLNLIRDNALAHRGQEVSANTPCRACGW